MLRNLDELTRRLRAVHEAIRDEVLAVCESSDTDALSRVVGDDAGDTIFAIDRVSEAALLERFAPIARDYPCLLIAEGLGNDGRQILPQGAAWDELEMVVLVDPIDGTRGLMYQKRSAWILTGIAPLRRGARANARRHRARGANRDPAGEAAFGRRVVGDQGRRGRRRTL